MLFDTFIPLGVYLSNKSVYANLHILEMNIALKSIKPTYPFIQNMLFEQEIRMSEGSKSKVPIFIESLTNQFISLLN